MAAVPPTFIRDALSNARLQAMAPAIVASICALALVLDVGGYAYRWRQKSAAQSGTAAAATVGRTGLAIGDLFGRAVSETEAVAAPGSLVLRGTLSLGDPSRGFAIIVVAGSASLYLVGADVAGARLQEVYSDHIILERNGVLETLGMAKPDHNFIYAGNASVPNAAVEAPYEEPRPIVAEVRHRVAVALAPVATVIDAHPKMNGELYRSLVVRPGPDSEAFARLGLKPGDEIMAVNHKQVNPDSFAMLTKDLTSGRAVTVYVDRPEGPVEITLHPAALQGRVAQ